MNFAQENVEFGLESDNVGQAAIPFKERYTLDERIYMFRNIQSQNPTKIIIIVEPRPRSALLPLDRFKFICSPSIEFGSIMQSVRGRLKLTSSDGVFFYVGDRSTASPHSKLGALYEKHRDEDGFLYFKYDDEPVYGL